MPGKLEAKRLAKVEKALSIDNGVVTIAVDDELIEVLENAPNQIRDPLRLLLSKQKAERHVDDVDILMDEFTSIWALLPQKSLPHNISVVVGIGGKKITGMQLDTNDQANEHAFVSLQPSSQNIQIHHPLWLETFINNRLESKGCNWQVDPASVQSLQQRAVIFGENISQYKIIKKPRFNPHRKGDSFAVHIRPATGDIVIVLGELHSLTQENMESAILKEVRIAIEKMSLDRKNTGIFRVFLAQIRQQLELAYHGCQIMGCGLPFSFLGALRLSQFPQVSDVDPLLPLSYLRSLKSDIDLNSANLVGMNSNDVDINSCYKTLKNMHIVGENKKTGKPTASNLILLRGLQSASQSPDYCRRGMEAAKIGIKKCPKAKRDYQTLMIGLSKNSAQYLQSYENFKKRALKIIDSSTGADLYQFNLQFFPLSSIAPKPPERMKNIDERFRDSHWCKILIREMAGLPGAQNDPSWFCAHLIPDVPIDSIQTSLQTLKKNGFIKVDQQTGRLKQTFKDIITENPGYAQGTQFHCDVLDLALGFDAWEVDHQGDIVATTFGTNEQTREQLQIIYTDFLKEIFDQSNHTVEPNIIYQLSLQLFPI